MIPSCSMDYDGSIVASTLNLPYAEAQSLEPPSDLGCTELHKQPVAFDVRHTVGLHPV